MTDRDGALRLWARLLAWAWGLVLVLAVLVVAVAVLLVLADSSSDQGDWDGFGTSVGVLGVLAAAPVLLSAVVMVVLVRSGRRRHADTAGDVERLRIAGVASLVWIAAALVVLVGLSGSLGTLHRPVSLVLVALVGVPAAGVVAVTRGDAESDQGGNG